MTPDQNHNEDQTAKRRDDALRRALQTPPKPKQESVKGKERKAAKGRPSEHNKQKPG